MVPPNAGDNVGDTEDTSVSKCFGSVPGSSSAGKLPDGFITSAHVTFGQDYVQITGTIDPLPYKMDTLNDTGGQYDNAPKGIRPDSACAGYTSYLEYIGPIPKIFCLRCCKGAADCNASQDLLGCVARMGGIYDPNSGFTLVNGSVTSTFAGPTPTASSSSRVPSHTSTIDKASSASIKRVSILGLLLGLTLALL